VLFISFRLENPAGAVGDGGRGAGGRHGDVPAFAVDAVARSCRLGALRHLEVVAKEREIKAAALEAGDLLCRFRFACKFKRGSRAVIRCHQRAKLPEAAVAAAEIEHRTEFDRHVALRARVCDARGMQALSRSPKVPLHHRTNGNN
jgi:hypothetical protein